MSDKETTLAQIEAATREGDLSPSAAENIRRWLNEPYFEEYVAHVTDHVAVGKWRELDDAFWTIIPFGTGGRRGKMYPIGTNAINDRTIGESAQGLADFVKDRLTGKPLRCAIAYDTRHRSRHFAELCAQIMVAAGFTVYFLDGYRSTPELSFAVRYKECSCGIMITASHNPPSDNAVKIYGPTGGQLLPPYDKQCIDRMQSVTWIRHVSFQQAVSEGKVVYCQEEVDRAFLDAVMQQNVEGPRAIKILYSPLHGVGASAVCPVLERAGFSDVEVFGPHANADPDFTNVPNHSANPENAVVFDIIIDRARETGAELIMATDPDADRLGIAVPATGDPAGAWVTLTGNQLGSLLVDFALGELQRAGTLTPEHYVVKTLVTTELIRRVADHYGATTVGDLLVGFKYIGGVMDERGIDKFVLGLEESYGYLAGGHARDKDAAVASLLTATMAARCKAEGATLTGRLDDLYRRHGCHTEGQFSVMMPGEQGMEDMNRLMARLREAPPEQLAGLRVAQYRDYAANRRVLTGGESSPLEGPTGDMIFFDFDQAGNHVAVRPSGTEPKVKFYLFACDPPEPTTANLPAVKAAQRDRLAAFERDLREYAGV
ncbi:MAG: phospho-sugar mutase [Thermoguttaceae bacterium]|jgi:phosphoglucomutase/phosphomannomutase|nr:phospho-sugar mutase [Thermoguttaceae bacterium]